MPLCTEDPPANHIFCDLFALTGSPLGQNTAKKAQAHLTFSVIQIACGNFMLTYLTKERMNSQSVLTLFSYPAHDGCMGHQDRQSTMLIMFSDFFRHTRHVPAPGCMCGPQAQAHLPELTGAL